MDIRADMDVNTDTDADIEIDEDIDVMLVTAQGEPSQTKRDYRGLLGIIGAY